MDELDKKIKLVLEKDVGEHRTFEYSIKNALNSKNKLSIKIISFKNCIAFLLTLLVGSGVAFAANKTYEKVWKEPEVYTVQSKISEDEMRSAITEDEARNVAEKYLKKLNLPTETFKASLQKDSLKNEIFWSIGITNGFMEVSNNGDFVGLNIPTSAYKIPYNFGITANEAEKVANELFKKYNPELNINDYKLVSLKANDEEPKDAYIWYADFYKKYGDKVNLHEKVCIGWIPTINGLYSYSEENVKYEDNEKVISKEEAIKIVKEKDKIIAPNYEIKTVEAELGMDMMNAVVKYREDSLEDFEKGFIKNYIEKSPGVYVLKEDAKFYKIDERVRNVWEVKLTYDNNKTFIYFIDCTTGEIIGGAIEYGDKVVVDNYLKDPYNYMSEK